MRSASLVTLVTLATLGCGDGNGVPSSVSFENLPPVMADVACDKLFQCCTDAEIAAMTDGFPVDHDLCQEMLTSVMADLMGEFMPYFAAGTATYNEAAAGTCLRRIDSLSCSEYFSAGSGEMLGDALGQCEVIFAGTVANGDACDDAIECISQSCVSTVDGDFCAPLAMGGESCEGGGECVNGFYCDYSGSDRVCVALKNPGDECNFEDECVSDECVDGFCLSPELMCLGY